MYSWGLSYSFFQKEVAFTTMLLPTMFHIVGKSIVVKATSFQGSYCLGKNLGRFCRCVVVKQYLPAMQKMTVKATKLSKNLGKYF
jgi:hypothetical protein